MRLYKKWVCFINYSSENFYSIKILIKIELFELVEQADLDGLKQKIELQQVDINW